MVRSAAGSTENSRWRAFIKRHAAIRTDGWIAHRFRCLSRKWNE
jgi:hypothetical protein